MKLLVLPGDGIGPEIMDASLTVLAAADKRYGLGLDFETMDIGLKAHAEHGSTLPDHVMQAADAADGVLLGPVDTYAYPAKEDGGINVSAGMRKGFDLYANIRPSKVRPGVPSLAKQMDLVICRENTEGFYADRNMFLGSGEFMPTEDVALAVRKITRAASERIARAACELAMRRRKKVTAVHKANVMKMTDGLFLAAFRHVAKDYPELELEELIVDAMAAHLIRRPADFDVIVTTNAFGDILSDEAAELSGGLGVGGSINHSETHGVAQAAHGAAPDIAGKGIANPTALITSVAQLLDWLGGKHVRDDLKAAAQAIEDALDATLSGGNDGRTPDLGGSLSTKEFGERVAKAVAD